jgi:hypothetical protein
LSTSIEDQACDQLNVGISFDAGDATFAINHAAAALAVKRRYPNVPLVWLLVSVQLSELLWVAFNYIGIERTTTNDTVRYVGDIHLSSIAWSHSIASGFGIALLAWFALAKGLRRPVLGAAVGVAIASHVALDLLVHARDIQLAPGILSPLLGSGFYQSVPMLAFGLEFAFGLWCWWYYGGSRGLLAVIVVFNVANLSFFTTAISGPETLLAHRPMLIVTMIFFQIVITLWLVGLFARGTAPHRATGEI